MMKLISALAIAAAAGLAIPRLLAEEPPAALSDARVTLPYSELKALLQMREAKPKAPRPPVDSSILSGEYELHLDGAVASGTATFVVQSFSDTWTVTPLLPGNIQIERIEPDTAEVILEKGRYALVTDKPGRTTVRFGVALRVETDGNIARLSLDKAQALANRLTLTGVPEGMVVRVHGATPIPGDKIAFLLPGSAELHLEISPPEKVVPPAPSRWNASSSVFATVVEEKIEFVSRVEARAESGDGVNFTLALPASAHDIAVESEDLDIWRDAGLENGVRQLEIRWKTAGISDRSLDVRYETPLPPVPGKWELAGPEVINGETVQRLFAVAPGAALELKPLQPANARPPRWLATLMAVRPAVIGTNSHFEASWLPLVPPASAVIDQVQSVMRVVPDGALLSEMKYAIRHETPFTWQLVLPEKTEFLACTVNGNQVSPIDRGAGRLEIRLPAPNSERCISEVKISYTGHREPFAPVSGNMSFELPLTELLIHRLDWELRIPPVYELAALEGNVLPAGGSSERNSESTIIRLRKELCRNERPAVQLFYQKPVK